MDNNLSADETKVVSLFGVINACLIHERTPTPIKHALSSSLVSVLMDERDQFGFKGSDLQNDLLVALKNTLTKLQREEDGKNILNSISLN